MFKRLSNRLPIKGSPWRGAGLQAAVLVALTDEPQPRVILGRRAQHLRLHPGEVAFPGGKRELLDSSPWATAIREAHEEIGLDPECVQPLAELPPLVTRTGYEVYPCIAKVPQTFDMVVDPGELESVFITPLTVFANNGSYCLENISDEEGSRKVPHFHINEDDIWGVTAAVLVQLVNVALNAKLEITHNWGVKS